MDNIAHQIIAGLDLFVVKKVLILIICILFLSPNTVMKSAVSMHSYDEEYWPTDTWRVSSLKEQDMNIQRIEKLTSRIEEGSAVRSLIIIRNGYIVYEDYRQGYDSESLFNIFSCTKSFTSALIGIAIRDGYINSIDDYILPYFPNWTVENVDERKERVTIKNLLTMTPGFDWNEHNISYSSPDNMVNQMLASDNPAKFVLDLKMISEPGLDHEYNTGASQVLSALIREVTGERPMSYARENLFNPLGISETSWALTRVDTNLGGSQLYMRTRDMARFGYLYLRGGVWGEVQIIPSLYVNETQQPLISTSYGHEYGLHWWVDEDHGYYCALGSEGQGIFIDSVHDLIMVITGGSNDIPMEVYFENYVQRAASEGYTGEVLSNPEPTDYDNRGLILLAIVISGVVAIIVVIFYPRKQDEI